MHQRPHSFFLNNRSSNRIGLNVQKKKIMQNHTYLVRQTSYNGLTSYFIRSLPTFPGRPPASPSRTLPVALLKSSHSHPPASFPRTAPYHPSADESLSLPCTTPLPPIHGRPLPPIHGGPPATVFVPLSLSGGGQTS